MKNKKKVQEVPDCTCVSCGGAGYESVSLDTGEDTIFCQGCQQPERMCNCLPIKTSKKRRKKCQK